ncbi:MAG TPA: M42 family metallopeptidase [Methanothrix sp.]|nr:M42 family metallopeptidase [Methanothrix sp.]HOV81089.1 M42 family metallopeptidase [Methanothrix sp.]HPC89241.1 M42 family metallopeptidase [Methanothrix sp.]HQE86690.1 M42 family metallopeptidase [Methanothrix sp.]HQI67220.1 M42 family metallopeptidase [Methanothrix sp.]
MSDIKSLLEKLSNAHGISGWEGSVQEIVSREIAPYVDEVRIDRLGNLIAVRNGERPSIMIEAHADEIGLMVKQVDEKGFLRFIRIGGWFDQTLLNQRVIIHTRSGPVTGVIGCKPPHVMKEEERKKVIEGKDMFIDIGCTSQKEAEDLGILVGTPVSIDRTFATLQGDRVTGKAFDNRAGLVAVIEALKRTKSKSAIYAVATVQEEVGLKGARVAAFGLEPDVAIAADVTIPGDHPGIEKKDAPIEMGKGPVVVMADASGRGIIATPQVIEWIAGTAREFQIPVQLEASDGGTTDATAIYLTKSGIPTGVISVATRYIHSPVEVLSLRDIDKAADLVARCLETAGRYFK